MYADYPSYSQSDVSERSAFITRTYAHLLGAVLSFIALEVFIFKGGYAQTIAATLMQSWMLTLGGFMLIGWIGSKYAAMAESPVAQYVGLALYVVAEAIIFVPMLFIAEKIGGGLIESAAQITIIGFLGLSTVAFVTRKDFSFLRAALMWGGVVALIIVFAALIFGLKLGVWFSIGMIALAGGSILYDTSNIIQHYPTDRHVSASLELFASVALMFWYVLRLLIQLQGND
jgi:hypothetical protein